VLVRFCHVDGTYEKKPLKQRYHQFPDGTRVGRDLYSAFLARDVQNGCLDAIQAANAWTGTQAFLRAASDGFEPARGRGFALAHVTLAVRAGRSNNRAKCAREAGNAVAIAHLAAARVAQTSAAGTEALALTRASFTVLVRFADQGRACGSGSASDSSGKVCRNGGTALTWRNEFGEYPRWTRKQRPL
jgi:hypothetical protein